jgi:GDP-4-dehydro-6-deoxy-D-mannose reductase
MEDLADYYRRRGLDCVVVRPFNHIGPGQSTGYLIPDLVTKLHAYLTEGEQITVGNLTTRRDYTDVRDVTAAYLAIAATKKLNSAVYNVCGGSSHSGQEMMNLLAKVMDVKLSPDTVKIDRSLVRPTDIAEIYGSHAKLTTDTGWEPRIPLEDTLKDVVEDWRSHN